MGKLSIHVKHFKSAEINGLDMHNRRIYKNHSNQDIDASRSCLNVTLVEPADGKSLYQHCKEKIAAEVTAYGGRVTKASVWVSEVCAHLPEDVPNAKSKEYFEAIVEYFRIRGEGQVVGAVIHHDEKNPHVHMQILNIKEHKLNRREIWTKSNLCRIHNELPEFLQHKGFNVERGKQLESAEEKIKAKMPFREYKQYMEAKETAEAEINDLKGKYNDLADDYNKALEERMQLKKGNQKIAKEILQNRSINR